MGTWVLINETWYYTQTDRDSTNCTYALNNNGNVINPVNGYFASLSSLLTGMTIAPYPAGTCLTIGADGLAHAVKGKLNQNNLSWRAGIDWEANENALIYANVSKGYKAGSFGTLAGGSDTSYIPVTQESVITYEAGVKAQLFDRRLSVNGAAFYSNYRDKQIKSKLLDPLFGYLLALVNVPKSEIKGFEIEATGRPVPGLTLGGAVTYLDTKIKDSTGPDGLPLITMVNNQTNSAGNPIPYASKWTLAGNVNYAFAINASSDIFVGAQIMHRTKTNASIGNEPLVDIPGYTTVDAQLGVDFASGRYRMMIWGKNIFNEFYLTNRNSSFDGVAQDTGRPVTYGITLSGKF